jgi:catechol 2,3-dioxygenase-like lactoylglutathione lyase family enzyme
MDEEIVPVLYVEDAARAVAWYGRLGFVKEWEHQFEPGFPRFLSVGRGNARLYLSEHKGERAHRQQQHAAPAAAVISRHCPPRLAGCRASIQKPGPVRER